jgi:hypothetical protein
MSAAPDTAAAAAAGAADDEADAVPSRGAAGKPDGDALEPASEAAEGGGGSTVGLARAVRAVAGAEEGADEDAADGARAPDPGPAAPPATTNGTRLTWRCGGWGCTGGPPMCAAAAAAGGGRSCARADVLIGETAESDGVWAASDTAAGWKRGRAAWLRP